VSSSSAGTMMPPVLAGAASSAGNTITRLRARTFGRKWSLGENSIASASSASSLANGSSNAAAGGTAAGAVVVAAKEKKKSSPRAASRSPVASTSRLDASLIATGMRVCMRVRRERCSCS
jgi:hypothetical protein